MNLCQGRSVYTENPQALVLLVLNVKKFLSIWNLESLGKGKLE